MNKMLEVEILCIPHRLISFRVAEFYLSFPFIIAISFSIVSTDDHVLVPTNKRTNEFLLACYVV